jgi:hypothetical protein
VTAGISFEDLVKGLRGWARGQTRHEQAAAELLIWHETWLRRPDFRGACIIQRAPGLVAIINWDAAENFVEWHTYAAPGQRPLPASTSEHAILDVVVTLGTNQLRLAGLGHAHRRAVAEAFAAALGQRLEPRKPGHNHPGFIPGDPETCPVCAQESSKRVSGSE